MESPEKAKMNFISKLYKILQEFHKENPDLYIDGISFTNTMDEVGCIHIDFVNVVIKVR